MLQEGAGTTWIDDLKLELVSNEVQPTPPRELTKPANLDFEAAQLVSGAPEQR